jgi:hypothetical protein
MAGCKSGMPLQPARATYTRFEIPLFFYFYMRNGCLHHGHFAPRVWAWLSVIDHRTDGAVFAGINLHLNGLRLRFPFKNIFVREHFAISRVAVLAPEFEGVDLTAMAKHVRKTSRRKARSLGAFPAAGTHEHSVARSLSQCIHCSCHENKMRT